MNFSFTNTEIGLLLFLSIVLMAGILFYWTSQKRG